MSVKILNADSGTVTEGLRCQTCESLMDQVAVYEKDQNAWVMSFGCGRCKIIWRGLLKAFSTASVILLLFVVSAIAQEPTSLVVIEAENMTVSGGGNRAVPDGWVLLGAGTIKASHIFKTSSPQLEIIARGDFAGDAWPILEVKIGSVYYDTIEINSATWKTFSLSPGFTFGAQNVELTFTNDFYEGTPETDRNFYLDKIMISESMGDRSVSLAWDANTEADLEGYNIYYGKESRFNTLGAIAVWCLMHEPNNTECYDEWKKLCTDNVAKADVQVTADGIFDVILSPAVDPACHPKLFQYDTKVDVKNVTNFTLRGLYDGTYFIAAIAYDTADNVSYFSEELTHTFYAAGGADPPANPGGVTRRLEGLSDTVKEPK